MVKLDHNPVDMTKMTKAATVHGTRPYMLPKGSLNSLEYLVLAMNDVPDGKEAFRGKRCGHYACGSTSAYSRV